MQKIGFIGLGLMGAPMAAHVLAQGYDLLIWNRTPEKCFDLQRQGAQLMTSSEELISKVDVLLLCLTDEQAVSSILFGSDQVLVNAKNGLTIVDHSTIAPKSAIEIGKRCQEASVNYIDAPVTGSVVGAKQGSLVVYIGGRFDDLSFVKSIMESYSHRINYMGEQGFGQMTKVCNQVMLHNIILSTLETMELAKRQGIDSDKLIDAFQDNLIDSKAWRIFSRASVSELSDRIAYIKDMMKDLGYILEAADRVNSPLWLTSQTARLVESMMQQERGYEDVIQLKELYEQPFYSK